jgi:hypothetical protein
VADIGARTESTLGLLIGAYDIQLTCMDQRKGQFPSRYRTDNINFPQKDRITHFFAIILI